MKEHDQREIARMDWNRFEESLQTAARGKRGGASGEAALREYLGDEEYAYLQKLATHARTARSRGPVAGNVVLVPGIMGSNLITIEKDGDQDLVWVSLFRLAFGQIERLKLSPDGSREAELQIHRPAERSGQADLCPRHPLAAGLVECRALCL